MSCSHNRSLFSVDPITSRVEVLAAADINYDAAFDSGISTFGAITDVVVMDRERCVYICDTERSQILRVADLPSHLFSS